MSNKKILDYSIDNHFKNATAEVQKLFLLLDPKILKLKDVENYSRSNYIAYKHIAGRSPFVEMHFRKRTNKIEIHLRPINYSFSKLNIYEVTDSHLWKLNTIVSVFIKDEIDLAMDLIRKSYDHVLQY